MNYFAHGRRHVHDPYFLSGTAVPDMSIEVDNLEEALMRVRKAGIAIEYGPTTEPWGVRRFYVRDPFGKLINILQHEQRG